MFALFIHKITCIYTLLYMMGSLDCLVEALNQLILSRINLVSG